MKKINKNKDFLTVMELAKMLSVSRITIFNRIKSGQIKAIKAGRNYIIYKKDVADLISDELTNQAKKEIDKAVTRVIVEYGDVLKKLGEE